MTLKLVKIVEGMGDGNVLYHSIGEFPLHTGRNTCSLWLSTEYLCALCSDEERGGDSGDPEKEGGPSERESRTQEEAGAKHSHEEGETRREQVNGTEN